MVKQRARLGVCAVAALVGGATLLVFVYVAASKFNDAKQAVPAGSVSIEEHQTLKRELDSLKTMFQQQARELDAARSHGLRGSKLENEERALSAKLHGQAENDAREALLKLQMETKHDAAALGTAATKYVNSHLELLPLDCMCHNLRHFGNIPQPGHPQHGEQCRVKAHWRCAVLQNDRQAMSRYAKALLPHESDYILEFAADENHGYGVGYECLAELNWKGC